MKNVFRCAILLSLVFLSSFTVQPVDGKLPGTITRTTALVDGKTRETTVIQLDGSTSREELIHTCNYLAKEGVQLTFGKLVIGRSFLGLVGKPRIRIAEGKIVLANGTTQSFKAGGVTAFRVLRIQYASLVTTDASRIEMIEIME